MADAVAEQLGFVPDQADNLGFVPDKAADLGFVADKPTATLAPGAAQLYEKPALQGGTPSPDFTATPRDIFSKPGLLTALGVGPKIFPAGRMFPES